MEGRATLTGAGRLVRSGPLTSSSGSIPLSSSGRNVMFHGSAGSPSSSRQLTGSFDIDAKHAIENEDYHGALQIANQLLKKHPESPVGLALLGRAHRGLGRNEDALQALRRAIATGDSSIADRVLLTQLLVECYPGDPKKMEEAEGIALALEDKMRLLRRAGKDFDLDELTRTLALRCQIVKSQRKVGEYEAFLNEKLKVYPHLIGLHRTFVSFLEEAGQYKRALEYVKHHGHAFLHSSSWSAFAVELADRLLRAFDAQTPDLQKTMSLHSKSTSSKPVLVHDILLFRLAALDQHASLQITKRLGDSRKVLEGFRFRVKECRDKRDLPKEEVPRCNWEYMLQEYEARALLHAAEAHLFDFIQPMANTNQRAFGKLYKALEEVLAVTPSGKAPLSASTSTLERRSYVAKLMFLCQEDYPPLYYSSLYEQSPKQTQKQLQELILKSDSALLVNGGRDVRTDLPRIVRMLEWHLHPDRSHPQVVSQWLRVLFPHLNELDSNIATLAGQPSAADLEVLLLGIVWDLQKDATENKYFLRTEVKVSSEKDQLWQSLLFLQERHRRPTTPSRPATLLFKGEPASNFFSPQDISRLLLEIRRGPSDPSRKFALAALLVADDTPASLTLATRFLLDAHEDATRQVEKTTTDLFAQKAQEDRLARCAKSLFDLGRQHSKAGRHEEAIECFVPVQQYQAAFMAAQTILSLGVDSTGAVASTQRAKEHLTRAGDMASTAEELDRVQAIRFDLEERLSPGMGDEPKALTASTQTRASFSATPPTVPKTPLPQRHLTASPAPTPFSPSTFRSPLSPVSFSDMPTVTRPAPAQVSSPASVLSAAKTAEKAEVVTRAANRRKEQLHQLESLRQEAELISQSIAQAAKVPNFTKAPTPQGALMPRRLEYAGSPPPSPSLGKAAPAFSPPSTAPAFSPPSTAPKATDTQPELKTPAHQAPFEIGVAPQTVKAPKIEAPKPEVAKPELAAEAKIEPQPVSTKPAEKKPSSLQAAASFAFGAPSVKAAPPTFDFGPSSPSTGAASSPAVTTGFSFGASNATLTQAPPSFGFGTLTSTSTAPSFVFGGPTGSIAPAAVAKSNLSFSSDQFAKPKPPAPSVPASAPSLKAAGRRPVRAGHSDSDSSSFDEDAESTDSDGDQAEEEDEKDIDDDEDGDEDENEEDQDEEDEEAHEEDRDEGSHDKAHHVHEVLLASRELVPKRIKAIYEDTETPPPASTFKFEGAESGFSFSASPEPARRDAAKPTSGLASTNLFSASTSASSPFSFGGAFAPPEPFDSAPAFTFSGVNETTPVPSTSSAPTFSLAGHQPSKTEDKKDIKEITAPKAELKPKLEVTPPPATPAKAKSEVKPGPSTGFSFSSSTFGATPTTPFAFGSTTSFSFGAPKVDESKPAEPLETRGKETPEQKKPIEPIVLLEEPTQAVRVDSPQVSVNQALADTAPLVYKQKDPEAEFKPAKTTPPPSPGRSFDEPSPAGSSSAPSFGFGAPSSGGGAFSFGSGSAGPTFGLGSLAASLPNDKKRADKEVDVTHPTPISLGQKTEVKKVEENQMEERSTSTPMSPFSFGQKTEVKKVEEKKMEEKSVAPSITPFSFGASKAEQPKTSPWGTSTLAPATFTFASSAPSSSGPTSASPAQASSGSGIAFGQASQIGSTTAYNQVLGVTTPISTAGSSPAPIGNVDSPFGKMKDGQGLLSFASLTKSGDKPVEKNPEVKTESKLESFSFGMQSSSPPEAKKAEPKSFGLALGPTEEKEEDKKSPLFSFGSPNPTPAKVEVNKDEEKKETKPSPFSFSTNLTTPTPVKEEEKKVDEKSGSTSPSAPWISLPSGVKYRVIKKGSGTEHATPAHQVAVYYQGKLAKDGSVFAPMADEERTFKLHTVIPAWKEVLPLMVAGDVWEVDVPPKSGYGDRGKPPKIPPNSQLLFEIHLERVVKIPAVFMTGGSAPSSPPSASPSAPSNSSSSSTSSFSFSSPPASFSLFGNSSSSSSTSATSFSFSGSTSSSTSSVFSATFKSAPVSSSTPATYSLFGGADAGKFGSLSFGLTKTSTEAAPSPLFGASTNPKLAELPAKVETPAPKAEEKPPAPTNNPAEPIKPQAASGPAPAFEDKKEYKSDKAIESDSSDDDAPPVPVKVEAAPNSSGFVFGGSPSAGGSILADLESNRGASFKPLSLPAPATLDMSKNNYSGMTFGDPTVAPLKDESDSDMSDSDEDAVPYPVAPSPATPSPLVATAPLPSPSAGFVFGASPSGSPLLRAALTRIVPSPEPAKSEPGMERSTEATAFASKNESDNSDSEEEEKPKFAQVTAEPAPVGFVFGGASTTSPILADLESNRGASFKLLTLPAPTTLDMSKNNYSGMTFGDPTVAPLKDESDSDMSDSDEEEKDSPRLGKAENEEEKERGAEEKERLEMMKPHEEMIDEEGDEQVTEESSAQVKSGAEDRPLRLSLQPTSDDIPDFDEEEDEEPVKKLPENVTAFVPLKKANGPAKLVPDFLKKFVETADSESSSPSTSSSEEEPEGPPKAQEEVKREAGAQDEKEKMVAASFALSGAFSFSPEKKDTDPGLFSLPPPTEEASGSAFSFGGSFSFSPEKKLDATSSSTAPAPAFSFGASSSAPFSFGGGSSSSASSTFTFGASSSSASS